MPPAALMRMKSRLFICVSCREANGDTEEVKSKARQALTYRDAGQQSPDPPSSGSASFSTTHLKEEAEEPEEEAI